MVQLQFLPHRAAALVPLPQQPTAPLQSQPRRRALLEALALAAESLPQPMVRVACSQAGWSPVPAQSRRPALAGSALLSPAPSPAPAPMRRGRGKSPARRRYPEFRPAKRSPPSILAVARLRALRRRLRDVA